MPKRGLNGCNVVFAGNRNKLFGVNAAFVHFFLLVSSSGAKSNKVEIPL